jgi:hypothetical protein
MSERLTLTAADEYFCHQTVQTFEEVLSTDRNWTEKSYIVAFDDQAQVMVTFGLGKYTNRNVMDGFAGVALPGRQINVRASRVLRPDLDTLAVGPLSWQIVEPPYRNRVRCAGNEQGVEFDVEFVSRYQPIVGMPGRRRVNGITDNHTIRYFQPGAARGEVRVNGRTYSFTPERSWGYKDRSWGVRSMTGIPREGSFWFNEDSAAAETALERAGAHGTGILHGYLNLGFETFSISCLYTQGPDGKSLPSPTGSGEGFVIYPVASGRAPVRILRSDLAFEFWPGSRRGRQMRGTFHLEDGTQKVVETRWLGLMWNFRGGGYFGFRGWWQGKHMGASAVGGESLDLAEKATRDELYGCEEIAVSCACEGESGFGVLEPWAIGALPGYGIAASDLG